MARIVINMNEFEGEVRAMANRLQDFSVPLKAWGQHMVTSVKRNFLEQGRPSPWKPLKVNTLIRRYLRRGKADPGGRARFAPNPKIYKQGWKGAAALTTMVGFARSPKTGRILRSRHGGLNKFAPTGMVFKAAAVRAILTGQILRQDGYLMKSITSALQTVRRVIVGTNLVYAPPHQFGSPKQGIPQRQYLMIQEPEDSDEFADLLTRWVAGGGKFA